MHSIEKMHHTFCLPLHPDHTTQCDIVTADIVEQLIGEIGKIKTQLSNTELQLYEAHEKMADIIENVGAKNAPKCFHENLIFLSLKIYLFGLQHSHLREENESLKIENSNLTKVAKLMTTSMKESVDTSKR